MTDHNQLAKKGERIKVVRKQDTMFKGKMNIRLFLRNYVRQKTRERD